MDKECAWLCELTGETGGPEWWSLNPQFELGDWTKDDKLALRFARKQDAEEFIADAGWTRVTATEHIWTS